MAGSCQFDPLMREVLDVMTEREPQRVICLDNSFAGPVKTNAVQLKTSNLEPCHGS